MVEEELMEVEPLVDKIQVKLTEVQLMRQDISQRI